MTFYKNGAGIKQKLIEEMNKLGKNRMPFVFIINFDLSQYYIKPCNEINENELLYQINGFGNAKEYPVLQKEILLKKHPISYDSYLKKFQEATNHLSYGNSFLINLTQPTPITCNLTIEEIFYHSKARYKLYVPDTFVVFSPEIFIQIADGVISSYPMKGTIDAAEPCAAETILMDPKELAEHATIVDLIRNDLSRVSNHVWVERFRYIDEINTHEKKLLQISSKICGHLDKNYSHVIGNIICAMLPAGSVTGAPKPKTIDIIKNIEDYDRGFYTGVFGYFDGHNLDSGVMIRFIEKNGDNLYFKSGGGITVYSNPKKEYQELIDKVYVPVNRIN